MDNTVPFLDLITLHSDIKDELITCFKKALETGRFIGGPMVEEFEREFASFCRTKYAVGVGSGTDALRFALIASGAGKGDTVVTVPNTFIATTEAISQAGASIDFVDINERTYNMDVEKLREYLENQCYMDDKSGRPVSKRTNSPVKAIIPVHLYGQMADMDPIMELAERYNLIIIEDACQAHGAEYFSRKENAWRRAGSMGDAGAFSFYPGKNLGACGEAGAVTTNSEEIAQKIKMLRDHGQAKKYYHNIEGYNGRLDAIQAGILSIKLKHLDEWNEERREIAKKYNELLKDIDSIVLPYESESSRAVYHLYVIRVPHREKLQGFLKEKGINTAIHYPIPIHLQKAYEYSGYKEGDFPVTEKVATEILSLPIYPGLTEDQQGYIAEQIKTATYKIR